MNPIYLGVNIDHIATLRQARGTQYPDPVQAALEAERVGADSITLHLREDRRHIQERDVDLISQTRQTKVNLEMAVTEEMLTIAEKYKPEDVCLVPEKREELTTEGGLDVLGQMDKMADACARMLEAHIRVSLFIDADKAQIDAAKAVGAPVIEIHTGHYANMAYGSAEMIEEFNKIREMAKYAHDLGLQVNAGHGLNYHNTQPIASIPELVELNIGHAIVAQATMDGFGPAVREMKRLMIEARQYDCGSWF